MPTTEEQFVATVNWAQNSTNVLGWNATAGDGKLSLHMGLKQWGWNAFGASPKFLAVEFAQATQDDPISDQSVLAFCTFVHLAREAWPSLPLNFPTHAEAEHLGLTGKGVTGKADVFEWQDPRVDELRGRIRAQLAAMNIR